MSKQKLLVSIKDTAPGNWVVKLFPRLSKQFDVTIEVEEGGAASKVLSRNGIDFSSGESNLADFSTLLAGCSVPSELESNRVLEARGLNIPSVGICDGYGSFRRHRHGYCEVYLAPDGWVSEGLKAEDLASVVVGDAAAYKLSDPTAEMKQALEAVRKGGPVILWIAQRTLEELERVLLDLRSMEGAILVMGLHPDPQRWPDQQRIRELVHQSRMSDRIFITADIAKGMDSERCLSCLEPERDFVLGSYGGLLTTAVYNGYRIVLCTGGAVQRQLEIACPGATELPLHALVRSPVLTPEVDSTEWETLAFPDLSTIRRKILPFDVNKAVETIAVA